MQDRQITIRAIEAADEGMWRLLWKDYCDFYQTVVAESVTASTWRRILNADAPVYALIALDESGKAVGFANYVLHPHTWSDQTLCYLEDLFVSVEARGSNIGHSLIERLIEQGREHGWKRVYWHTNADNARARRLYDRFNPADDVVRYVVTL